MFLSVFFFFTQKTAYEMRISDWSSDVCSSDLARAATGDATQQTGHGREQPVSAGAATCYDSQQAGYRREQAARSIAAGDAAQQVGPGRAHFARSIATRHPAHQAAMR